ncbi:MAG: oligoendopeptidase F [Anaerovoracaceae bacterium]
MSKKLKQRNEIDPNYKWDIEDMYPAEDKWNADLEEALQLAEQYAALSGTLTKSSESLLFSLELKDRLWQTLEKPFVYARMRRDEDNREEKYQGMCDKAMGVVANVSALTSFSTPEILAAGEQVLLGFLAEEPRLETYRFALMDILRQQAHVLTHAEENILAQMSEVNSATNDIFTMLNNADMKFGTITDEDGAEVTLTHGNYITFMESHHREVRKQAFDKMYQAYADLINTIATSYNYNTKTDVITARIRKYESARAAALSGDNIPLSVYDNLVSVVNQSLPTLHRYMEVRKKVLGVEELSMHDVYVPLIELPKKDIPYEEALTIMEEGLAPLGEEYLAQMKKGLAQGWVDVYENEGKTSGAYSFGCYDSKPYILLNYTHTLKDVFTLVHEMGHSMHSYYTRTAQPFIYGGHSIFTAEVASTVNENLLMKHLIAKEADPQMKKYLLNLHIEEFRTTLFRQTMFAEFEQLTHEAIEKGETLTAGFLCSEYEKLNKKYFGDALSPDDYIQYEWARIPHFYNAFYVYKYATGYSAAAAISDIILKEGSKNYIEFLKSGESDYPIELLKIAGVDMESPEPIRSAMEVFETLVDEFERLM